MAAINTLNRAELRLSLQTLPRTRPNRRKVNFHRAQSHLPSLFGNCCAYSSIGEGFREGNHRNSRVET